MDGARDGNLQRKPPALQRTTSGRGGFGDRAWLVATVHSPETLHAAEALRTLPGAAPDLLELRVDHFADDPGALDSLVAAPPRPLVVTVRRADEGGGAPGLDDVARGRLYARFLPAATCVDLEVRSLGALGEVVRLAGQVGVHVIASFHDFQGTPDTARLRELAQVAVEAGADVFKVATFTRGPGDVARLLDLLEQETRLPLAVMGMGPLGRASRLVLAAAGSVLNYGYLGNGAQVPGQWSVAVLREWLEELSRAPG